MNNFAGKAMPSVRRARNDAVPEGRTLLDSYVAERERAQAAVIDVSMERRRGSAIPGLCDGGYEVFEQ